MIQLLISNTQSKIVAPPGILAAISEHLSYEIPGAHFARIPGWDGRKRLMKRDGTYPTGLTGRLIAFLKAEGLEYGARDTRVRPRPELSIKIDLGAKTPRYYQSAARDLVDAKPRGVFNIGTGGGKTVTSALIVDRIKVPTLFVTPDTGLRKQALKDYQEWFGLHNVGDCVTDPRPIIIANIQSCAKKDPKMFERFKALLIDEFHHSSASTYLDLNKNCKNAFYRYGFTGTFIRTDGTDMVMHGVLSNIIFKKSTSELIEEGFLVRPYITMTKIVLPKSKMSYKEAYDFITEYIPFNNVVADIAKEKIKEVKQTLILVRRKEHGRLLESMIPGSIFVSGDDKSAVRENTKKAFINKRIRCLIATEIFGEGQDIPSIDVLINARCQKTEIQTSQGIGRALRLFPGKDKAEVFDFYFEGQKHLKEHGEQRIMSYKKESAFKIRFVDSFI